MIETINPGVAATILGAGALLLFVAAAGPAYAVRLREQQWWEEMAASQNSQPVSPEPDLAPPELVLPEAHRELAPVSAMAVVAMPASMPTGRNGIIGRSSAIGSTQWIGRDHSIAGSSSAPAASSGQTPAGQDSVGIIAAPQRQ